MSADELGAHMCSFWQGSGKELIKLGAILLKLINAAVE
jgi:hypothetical protein